MYWFNITTSFIFVPRIPDVRMFSESPPRNLQAGLNLQTATVQSTELRTVASTVLPSVQWSQTLDLALQATRFCLSLKNIYCQAKVQVPIFDKFSSQWRQVLIYMVNCHEMELKGFSRERVLTEFNTSVCVIKARTIVINWPIRTTSVTRMGTFSKVDLYVVEDWSSMTK